MKNTFFLFFFLSFFSYLFLLHFFYVPDLLAAYKMGLLPTSIATVLPHFIVPCLPCPPTPIPNPTLYPCPLCQAWLPTETLVMIGVTWSRELSFQSINPTSLSNQGALSVTVVRALNDAAERLSSYTHTHTHTH